MTRSWRALDGILLFDKPLEMSSNYALQKVRRLYQAEKAGHTGTLDPLATGLLPICFGEATKFSTGLLDADKTYRATLRLGVKTTTGDAEGEVISERPLDFDADRLRDVLRDFTGEIDQLPPMHSALKHKGKPLYEYIRKGETVERQSRRVVIHELTLEHWEGEVLVFSVRCSKGTYVRTLAEDIGEALGCGAHLTGLRRTAIAGFSLSQAYDWDALQAMDAERLDGCLLPVDVMLPDYPAILLSDEQVRRIAQGQVLRGMAAPQGPCKLYDPAGVFVGLGWQEAGDLHARRLLSSIARRAANVPQPVGVDLA